MRRLGTMRFDCGQMVERSVDGFLQPGMILVYRVDTCGDIFDVCFQVRVHAFPLTFPCVLSITSPHQTSRSTVSVPFRDGNPQPRSHQGAPIIMPWHQRMRSVPRIFDPKKCLSPDVHAIPRHPRHVLTRLRTIVRETPRVFESSTRRFETCRMPCVQSLPCCFGGSLERSQRAVCAQSFLRCMPSAVVSVMSPL